MDYADIMREILILVAYITIGYVLRRLGAISQQGIKDMSRFVVEPAMPLMVFNSMIIEYESRHVSNMLQMAVAILAFLSFTLVASGKLVRLLKGPEEDMKATRYCMVFGNVALLGYPLCSALFGEMGTFFASVYVAVQNMIQWTIGVNIFKREKLSRHTLKNLVNPGIVAIAAGLLMFFLGLRPPLMLDRIIKSLGGTAVPLALVVTGATLYGFKLREIIGDRRVLFVSLFKNLAFPGIYLAVLYFVPMNGMLKSILAIQAAGPVQASSTAFAGNFQGNTVIPAKCIFLSTLACAVTIPLFLLLINL